MNSFDQLTKIEVKDPSRVVYKKTINIIKSPDLSTVDKPREKKKDNSQKALSRILSVSYQLKIQEKNR